ncbi:MAG: PAS domain-containing protein [Candidatus Latescibacteria bacterium]|nr:PAS domain-containing protein [Candidatus Latescibacterota bacterium]
MSPLTIQANFVPMNDEAIHLLREIARSIEGRPDLRMDDLLKLLRDYYTNPFLPCSPREIAYRLWGMMTSEVVERGRCCLDALMKVGLVEQVGRTHRISRGRPISLLALAFEDVRSPFQRELVELEINRRLKDESGLGEAKAQALLDSISSGVIFFDVNGHVVGANSTARRLIGRDPSTLAELEDVLKMPFPSSDTDAGWEVDRDRALWTRDTEVEGRFLRVTVGQFSPYDGPVRGRIITLLDITGEKLLAQFIGHDMKTLLHLLEGKLNRVGQWHQAQDGRVSHEKQERQTHDEPEVTSSIDLDLQEEIRSARTILTQLSRMREDIRQFFLRLQPEIKLGVSLRMIMKDCERQFTDICAERGVTFHVDYSDRLPRIDCDRDRILHVMQNLLSNAVKFVKKGGNIWVSGSAHAGWVSVAVADDGIGIPKEEQERIFLFGYRGKRRGTLGQVEGSGIGLALCRQIISMHGGTIDVMERDGGGCQFMVTLPIVSPTEGTKTFEGTPEQWSSENRLLS